MSSPLLLAVDDEVGVRESLKMVFCKEYRLLEAASVDAAMHQVQEEKPHVVLLDILLPKTDGLEILRQIKTIHPGCEVIILTGVNSQHSLPRLWISARSISSASLLTLPCCATK